MWTIVPSEDLGYLMDLRDQGAQLEGLRRSKDKEEMI